MVATRALIDAVNVHVWRSRGAPAVGLAACKLNALVRGSLHHYNDKTEVARFVRAVAG